MRLLNPSPGYVVDRLTILALKIEAAEKAKLNLVPFLAEKNSLEEYLRNWEQGVIEDFSIYGDDKVMEERLEKINKYKNGLLAVNSLIWEAQDTVRSIPDIELTKLAFMAKRHAKLSDARMEMVQELNELYGAGRQVEKIFGVPIGRVDNSQNQMTFKFV